MRYLSFIGLFLNLFSQTLCSQTLSDKIDAVITKDLPHATIGILIKEAKNGRVIYSKNADKLLSPASNMKLFTAAAALYYWKTDHRFFTTLAKKNKNYYLKFDGSPSLKSDNLVQLLSNLKKSDLKVIEGDVILDVSRIQAPYYTSGVSYDDIGWYYAAPDTAVILDENAVSYEITSAEKLGMPATIKPKKPGTQLTVLNEVITVSKEQAKNHCALNIETQEHNTVRLFGCIVQDKNPRSLDFALPDPMFLAKELIQKTLTDNNIKLKGHIISGKAPADAEFIASLQSDPLAKLINHMLKESDNLYADAITRQLGYALTKEGSSKQAVFALKEILTRHTKLDMTQLEIADGIGTRYNLVTAEQMTILLTNLYQDIEIFPTLFSSLPQSAVSGTLKDRMKKSILEKKVFAKTGSMHDISSLSGYLISPHGKSIIFSIIINGVNKPISKAKALEEQILSIIEEEINGDSPPSSEFA